MKLLKSSLSEPLELFLSHLDLERGLSEHTRNSYRYDILQFVELTKIRVFKDVTEKDTEAWQNALLDLKPASRARKLVSLRRFFEFLIKNNILSRNPLEHAVIPKLSRTLPHTLTCLFYEAYSNEHEDIHQAPVPFGELFDFSYLVAAFYYGNTEVDFLSYCAVFARKVGYAMFL